MIIKSKRGFTLIEVIVSLAIFAILLTVILAAFLTSAVISSRGGRKLKSMNYAEGIVQCVKSMGSSGITNIYNVNKTDIQWYIYFNENHDTDKNGYYDVLDYLKNNNYGKFSAADSAASADYKYKCRIKINKDNTCSSNNAYFVKIEVWDIKNNSNIEASKAVREIYIGR